MQRPCPVCGQPLSHHDIVCPACRQRIEAREPPRRESVLYAWGRGLMLFLAVVFFAKGAFATASPREYGSVARSFGVQSVSETAQFIGAAFTILAALLYAVAWAGSYVERAWTPGACLAALVVFVAGQGLARSIAASAAGGWAQGAALFVLWVSVPVFQYCALRLGQPAAEQPPERGTATQGEAA